MGLPSDVCRPWRWAAAALAALILLVGIAGPAVSASTASAEDPTAPTGRAVCNTAFTAAAVLGFGNFIVPPDAPLGPNEVVAALTPILQVCVDTYPPRPPTRCAVTAGLLPATPLPIAPPDLGGIVAEQTQALVHALGDPVRTALEGPLRNLFVTGLGCDVAASDDARLPPVPPSVTGPPATVVGGRPTPSSVAAPAGDGGAPALGPGAPRSAPLALTPVGRSLLPLPLRGVAAWTAAAVLVGLAVLLARQLTPRRSTSLGRATARRR